MSFRQPVHSVKRLNDVEFQREGQSNRNELRVLSADDGDFGDGGASPPLLIAGDGLERAGLAGGESGLTGMLTHFWQSTSLPVKVTRSPDGNGCL